MDFPDWFTGLAGRYFDSWLLPRQWKGKPVRKALQIGVYTGDASLWIMNKLPTCVQLDDVDTWSGSDEDSHRALDFSTVEDYYDERTREFRELGRIRKFKMTSDEFFATCDQTYDLIYIDADHHADQVLIDARNADKHLQRGGVMVFDDYGWRADSGLPEDTPKPAVDQLLEDWKSTYKVLTVGYQVWLEKN